MDPRSNSTSGLGLPQPGNDMGQLPSIHAPQTFHAPDTPASHFDTPVQGAAPASLGAMPIAGTMPMQPPAAIPIPQPQNSAAPQTTAQQLAQYNAEAESNSSFQAGPADDTDTAFDEEWVNKARVAVAQTHADPYLQSQQLGKVKAQYIKLRYNKDIKVSDD